MENNKQILKEKSEEKKLCPFNPGLECENCRFYQPYIGGKGKRECVFIILSWGANY